MKKALSHKMVCFFFMLLLNNGARAQIACIPHTTAALTDRGTASNEGFAIHLETLAAHTASEPVVKERYHHPNFLFGVSHHRRSEYYRQSMDLLTYS